jgi:hypothetical protein
VVVDLHVFRPPCRCIYLRDYQRHPRTWSSRGLPLIALHRDTSGLGQRGGVTSPAGAAHDERQAHIGAEGDHSRVPPVPSGAAVPVPVGRVAFWGPAPVAGDRVGELVSAPGPAVHDDRRGPRADAGADRVQVVADRLGDSRPVGPGSTTGDQNPWGSRVIEAPGVTRR